MTKQTQGSVDNEERSASTDDSEENLRRFVAVLLRISTRVHREEQAQQKEVLDSESV